MTENKAAETASDNRKTVEQAMREMVSVLWRSDCDSEYFLPAAKGADEKGYITVVANRLYKGLPYTPGAGSLFSFAQFFTSQENGVNNLSGLPENWKVALGNNCADCVFWAWARVSTSIDFTYSREMIPSHGCLRVGSYAGPDEGNDATKQDCIRNTAPVMFAAYVEALMGDALVKRNGTHGHAMLIVTVHVERTACGEIDGENSFMTVHQQRSAPITLSEVNGETCYQACGNDNRYSFQQLFAEGYLPVTCKELRDNTPPVAASITDSESGSKFDAGKLTAGTITANYRLSTVTIKILGKDGKAVQSATRFIRKSSMFRCDLASFAAVTAPDIGMIEPSCLTAGQKYRCTVTCQISTGKIFTVRDFDFTA